ncbi:MAG: efflux RND transporter periplasmic adaptor subunit [Myxococcota bacterium]
MRKWLLWSLFVAAASALALRATVFAPEPVPVRAVPAERGRVEATVTNTKAGTVRARRRAQLSAEIGGRVVEILHREGEQVEAGEPLLRLDNTIQRARVRLARESLRVAESARHQACVTRDRARRELERKRQLADKRIVSADLLDQLESAYESARASCRAKSAEVERARAQIALAEAELEKTVIRAPFAGVIAEVSVEVGEWITPSPPLLSAPPVVDVLDRSSLYISAPMDEVDSAAIRVGQPCKITIDSRPGKQFRGQVVRVAPYVLDIEAQNRTVEIEVELDDSESVTSLLPGTSADVEVVLEVHENVLRVPTASLLEGRRVLVVEEDRLIEREAHVGLRNWDWTEVLEGVEAGELVVTSLDRVEVKPGARVRIEEPEDGP